MENNNNNNNNNTITIPHDNVQQSFTAPAQASFPLPPPPPPPSSSNANANANDHSKIQAIKLAYDEESQKTTTDHARPEDILSVRGLGGTKNPGNVKFRKLVQNIRPLYEKNTGWKFRRTLAEGVLAELWPGRFLRKKLPTDPLYQVMTYEESVNKIIMAARDARRYSSNKVVKAHVGNVSVGGGDGGGGDGDYDTVQSYDETIANDTTANDDEKKNQNSHSGRKTGARDNRKRRKYDAEDTAANARKRPTLKDRSKKKVPLAESLEKETTGLVVTESTATRTAAAAAATAARNASETMVVAISEPTTTSHNHSSTHGLTQQEEDEIIQWIQEAVQKIEPSTADTTTTTTTSTTTTTTTNSGSSNGSNTNIDSDAHVNTGAKRKCEDIFHRIDRIVQRGSEERRRQQESTITTWFTPSHQQLVYMELWKRCKSAMKTGMSHEEFLDQLEANLVF